MAQQTDEGNFWLRSEFLTEDELLMGFKTDRSIAKRFNDFRNAYANSFGFGSELSSSAESVVGSAETESDEDDYITGLTRKLAYTTLGISNFSAENYKGWKFSGSPQSTLCSTRTGCGCMLGFGRVSRVSSTPDCEDAASWLSLLAAAEKGARMRLIEETAALCSANPFVHPRKPDTTDTNQGSGCYSIPCHHLSHQQLQAAQFQQLMQQQQASSYYGQGKIGHQEIVSTVKKNGGPGNQSLSMASRSSAQHSHPQRQPSSGTRVVFLGESESKTKRTGTGVFLPRKLEASPCPVETRKKTGCPVLLPDTVVNALNLNIKSMDFQLSQTLPKRTDLLEANTALKHRNTVPMVEQRRNLQPVPAGMGEELKLPQEWTY